MAIHDDQRDSDAPEEERADDSADRAGADERAAVGADGEASEQAEGAAADLATTDVAASMGTTRYVHAAFFSAGILAAYVSGKLVYALWNTLAAWPEAVRAVPQLLSYSEDERASIGLAIGAVVGVVGTFRIYRRDGVRAWADEVAVELSKVTWPEKDAVTSGTVVVVVASLIATAYIALLDKFWGFLTDLVYRA
ncbi:MAG: preprotein translocase subunit SecE [Polyangiaceae bacterium]|nr:preprotein translocase subunit SecE [Polyangiaceae bacterium]